MRRTDAIYSVRLGRSSVKPPLWHRDGLAKSGHDLPVVFAVRMEFGRVLLLSCRR